VKELEFENEVKECIIQQHEMDIAVHTKDIINHVIQVKPSSFKNSHRATLFAWVYKFLGHHGLSVHQVTHVGQKLSRHLKEVQDNCALAIRKWMAIGGTLHGIDLKFFINMDQTAVYFKMKSNSNKNTKYRE
jgi:hypothetical protein